MDANKAGGSDRENSVSSISVAAPAYNEAAGIEGVLQKWLAFLADASWIKEFEVVICNDGSKDQTGPTLDRIAASNSRVKVVHHEVNQGAAAALATAITNTKYAWVLLIDSDGQYGIETLTELAHAVTRARTKAAIGVRTKKHDSAFARFGSKSSGWLCNAIHGTHYRDFNCALKLVDGSVLRSLCLEARGLNYSTEISSKIINRGLQMTEVEVVHQPRAFGRSSAQNMRAAWHRILFVFYLAVRQFLIRQKIIR